MKNLLSVVIFGSAEKQSATLYDGIELLYADEGESEKDFLTRAAKTAKGKYTVICDRAFKFADVQSLLNIIDKNAADMVCFVSDVALKTSVLRTVAKDCEDCFSLTALTVFSCKTIMKTTYCPFSFSKPNGSFKENNTAGILLAAETFGKVKAKLPKEIYSYAFNMLCDKLVFYYMYAMLAIRDGALPAEKLIEFDNKLKAEIVLHLALEKRFTAAKLHKLREKGFKISRFKASKFRKILS